MLEIKYTDSEESSVTDVRVYFDDRKATLGEILLGFIKVCCLAGYYTESFDNLVEEAVEEGINERSHFEDFLKEYVYERKNF